MKKLIFVVFALFFLFSISEKVYAFERIDADALYPDLEQRSDTETFSGMQGSLSDTYEVWFLTEADCDDIRISLNGIENEYSLICEMMIGWKGVPPGTYTVVVKGCGGEFTAEEKIEKDTYLNICPSSLGLTDCCPEGVLQGGAFSCEECEGGPGETTTTASNTTTTTIVCPMGQMYGEYSAETGTLRNFRDDVLSKTSEGREIIKLYYQLSPLIMKAMEEDEEFKNQVKDAVDGILMLINK